MNIAQFLPLIANDTQATTCEIHLESEKMVLYAPCKASWQRRTVLSSPDFTKADAEARSMGFEPLWRLI